MTQKNPQEQQGQQSQQGQNVNREHGDQRQSGQQRQAEQSTGNNPGRQQGGHSDVDAGHNQRDPQQQGGRPSNTQP